MMRIQPVEGQADAVVGAAPLREVVGADPLAAVAAADLALAVGGDLRMLLGHAWHRGCGACSIFIALALFLCCDFSSWQATTTPVGMWVMRTADSVLLTCWPPAPGSAVNVDAQIGRIDLDIDILGFGEDRHGAGRGVNPPLRLGLRDPLHPVGAAFDT